jgi:WD40 repeat protein
VKIIVTTIQDLFDGDIEAFIQSGVRAIAVSPDGSTIASGSDGNTVRGWDARTGICLRVLHGHTKGVYSLSYAPSVGSANSSSGSILASSSNDFSVRLWSVHNGQCVKTVLQGHTNWVWSVAWSQDGKILASGSDDHTIRLWDVKTGECLATLHGHTSGVFSVSFSPDGLFLVSGSQEETLKIWNVSTSCCNKTLIIDGLYQGMNITGVRGLTQGTIATLKALGAIEI